MTLPIATILIIVFTVWASWRGFTSGLFIDSYVFSPVSVLRRGQYHRLVTAGFLHTGWIHLLVNMFSLYAFGVGIESSFGAHILLLVYFASIIGGNLLSLFLHRQDEGYLALGASGGVCGVIFAAIFLTPGIGIMIFPLPIAIPAWLFAIVFILVSFLGMSGQLGNIGHDAHLGGALVGLGVITALYPSVVVRSPWLFLAVTGLSAALFAYEYWHPSYLRGAAPFSADHWRRVVAGYRSRAGERRRRNDDAILERLLDKVSNSGLNSLNPGERADLEQISRRRKEEETRQREAGRGQYWR